MIHEADSGERKRRIIVPGEEPLPQDMPTFPQAGTHLPYGSFLGLTIDGMLRVNLLDASIDFLEFGETERELAWLDQIQAISNQGCNAKHDKSLADVAQRILKRETTFDLSNYNLYTTATGARGAIIDAARNLVSADRPYVAYSSPNWVFDKIVENIPGAKGISFFAPDADSFVNRFKKLDLLQKIAAVIVIDPQNPLGYRLSREQIEELEKVSIQNGIVPIFDDVFRGLQRRGNRHSSSEYSHESIIVETTSKRYGARGIGTTWTLIPKSLGLEKVVGLEIECGGCAAVAAIIADALDDTQHELKVRRKIKNNTKAFVSGLNYGLGETEDTGMVVGGFDAMPVFIYVLPKKYRNLGTRKLGTLANVLGVTAGFQWIPGLLNRRIPEEEFLLGHAYLRICPTKEDSFRSYFAGFSMGQVFSRLDPKDLDIGQGK